ncbi:uncharacterized protein LOC132276021 [Cornus florida]|uniref:uncharacterized protein LOC132276021 n=1 Tax=Cornus florida TaxID=4283 RepID=UPI00289E2E4F|nr:uncharacterized protein LOC132276021 [Cornus florida]
MAIWRSFGGLMLNFHRSMRQTWCNCSDLASFQYSSAARGGGGGLFLGSGCFQKAAHFSPIQGSCWWCSPSPPTPPPVSPPSLSSSPLLMLPPGISVVDHKSSEKYSDDNDKDYFHFFSLSEQRQFRVAKNIMIPWQRDLLTPDAARCVGSCHGWLAFNHPHNCHPYLYNPLIDTPDFPYIPLPSFETLPTTAATRILKSDHLSDSPSLIEQWILSLYNRKHQENVSPKKMTGIYLRRLAMSSPPSVPSYFSSSCGNDCLIMAIHSPNAYIAFCKLGDDSWTTLDGSYGPYVDLMYFSKDQRFYALTSNRSLVAWDLRDPSHHKRQVFDKLEGKLRQSYNCGKSGYLVESSGDLLLVSRYIVISDQNAAYAYNTVGFDVHRFEFDNNKWEPVECLGDRALFVGSNTSFSLSTRDYLELMGNSIYFTDDVYSSSCGKKYSGHDNGIFHLKDHSIKPYYPSSLKINPPPVWVAPNTME